MDDRSRKWIYNLDWDVSRTPIESDFKRLDAQQINISYSKEEGRIYIVYRFNNQCTESSIRRRLNTSEGKLMRYSISTNNEYSIFEPDWEAELHAPSITQKKEETRNISPETTEKNEDTQEVHAKSLSVTRGVDILSLLNPEGSMQKDELITQLKLFRHLKRKREEIEGEFIQVKKQLRGFGLSIIEETD